jgi:L-ribulose-5-phosphate 3-epimerase
MNRRQLLNLGLYGLSLGFTSQFNKAFAGSAKKDIMIGACDWSIGNAGQPEAMQLGQKIGLDGVQVSLGNVGNNMHLRQKQVQDAYKLAARQFNVKVASLGIAELNSIPYKSDPRAIEWVSDSIDVAKAMGVKVVLLAFFDKGDLKNDKPGQQEVIKRLKAVAPKAEKAGIVLGIESWLSAEEHMYIIDAVGSENIKVYYDVCNSTDMGYDIYREIRWLGKQNQICEFHMKENGILLGDGKIDFNKVRSAIEDINYRGWMQIEGAVPPGKTVVDSYVSNLKFLSKIFQR